MAKIKKRLDVKLHELLPEYDEKHIQSWVMQGKVFIDGEKVAKMQITATYGTDSKVTYITVSGKRITQ